VYVPLIILFILREDKDIIKVYNAEHINKPYKSLINILLKYCEGITEPK
jgi:hypothetical protein